jgi:hypothetical protein
VVASVVVAVAAAAREEFLEGGSEALGIFPRARSFFSFGPLSGLLFRFSPGVGFVWGREGDDDDVVAADGDTASALCLRPGSLGGCVLVLINLIDSSSSKRIIS